MPNRKKGNSASIRWKWGFRLMLAFLLFFSVFTTIMLATFQNRLHDKERVEAESLVHSISDTLSQIDTRLTDKNVESLMEKISVSTTSRGVLKVENIPLLDQWSQEGTIIQVFDSDAQLIYESKPTNTTFERISGYTFEEVTINNREAFIGKDTIVGESKAVLLGYVQVVFRLTDYHKFMADINQTVFLMIIAGVVVSILLGYGLSLTFFRPIKQMTDTMNEINEDTLSKSRIKIKSTNSPDELTDLSNQINDLLDKMGRYVTQQKQFVEDVSHELRTPTAIVEGHLKLLNRWGKDDPQVLDESLQASLNEITRMKTLVQEMLDLSRAEQVQMHYPNEMTPAVEVVTQVFHNFKMLYTGFVFHFDNDMSQERYIQIHRNHLEQILVILLDNAVKYSTDRKEIHISISETLSQVQIAIQDFGEGMSQEDQQKIFNRFYRVDKARSREKGGHGLGLSIAKELLENYHGDISVESVLGHGTIFRIQLPFQEDYLPEQEISAEE
ncbi:sensor histidine kinase [Jeotgalibaca caeni]|uniref:sensor histidine kinase n=1 Tax=Jeotgalibaca caeni TaxID=3028623 RepID=UPI00237E1BDE|nr:HAMP domain-containing histidine kinase [Jeotgalibaca caeni]MDE1549726.1 HAMP domain-containing histidine kinase [Jeotgalibaca caeni]